MINKVSQDWEKVEQSGLDSRVEGEKELNDVLKHIVRVRQVLKEMCDVAVTRSSLKNAVLEALYPVLREHREELVSELALPNELEDKLVEFAGRLVTVEKQTAKSDDGLEKVHRDVEERVAELGRRLDSTREEFHSLSEQHVEMKKQSTGDLERLREAEDLLRQVDQSVQASMARLGQIEGQVADVNQQVSLVDDRLDERFTEVDGRLTVFDDHFTKVDGRLTAFDDRFTEVDGRVTAFDDRFTEVDGRLTAFDDRFTEVEGNLTRLDQRFEEVESSLRKEIDDMVQALMEQFEAVREVLSRVEEQMPNKEAVSTANDRLQGLQERFEQVATQVTNIDSVTPEVRGMGQHFEELRNRVVALSSDVNQTGDGLGELRGEFSKQLSDLSTMLSTGISRWESDQTSAVERLTVMRDTLRDQLQSVGHQVESTQKGLIQKLTKRPSGLKMNRDEWDQLAGKMEGIISGLENVLTQKKKTLGSDEL